MAWIDDVLKNAKDTADKGINFFEEIVGGAKNVAGDTLKAIASNAGVQSILNFKLSQINADSIIAKVSQVLYTKFPKATEKFINETIDEMVSDKLFDKAVGENLKKALKGHPFAAWIVTIVSNSLIPLLQLLQTVQVSSQLAVQSINADIRPSLPDPSSVLGAAFIDNSTTKRIREVLAKTGWQEQDINLLFKSAYAVLNEGVIRELFFRGVYDKAKVYKRLRENRFTDQRIEELMQTWQLIPPVSDLITMAVREAFSEELVATLGLDLNFPKSFSEWAQKQGLSEDWAKKYWRAHWRLPSAEMGFEMLHRDVIDDKKLTDLLRALDYSPAWHENLKSITFNVMTRVDVRRLYQLGILNGDEMETKYRHMGYSPEDAKRLRKWTEIEYNQDIKSYTRGAVIKSYLEGFTTEEQAIDYLTRIGFTRARIEELMAQARYERGVAKRTSRIAALKRLFISGQYGVSEVQSDLSQFGIDDRVINELVDTWRLEQKAGLRLPRAIDLNEWLSQGVVTDDEYKREMARVGYSEFYVNLYFKAAKAKATKAPTAPAAPERRLLSKGELDALAKNKAINFAEYVAQMQAIGYSNTDAQSFWNIATRGA